MRTYKYCGQTVIIMNGEVFKDKASGILMYFALCRCASSLFLISCAANDNDKVHDFVDYIFRSIHETPLQYLMQTAADEPVFAFVFRQPDTDAAAYLLYRGYDVALLMEFSPHDLLGWAMSHYDNAEPRCLYTEIVDGQQHRIRF